MSCTTEIRLRPPATISTSATINTLQRKSRRSVGVLIIKSIWDALQRWQLRLRTEQSLNGLDDWMLKDIGISRSEIGYVAREASRDLK